jgi:ABC-type polysaccharide/polyol phosphate export permease
MIPTIFFSFPSYNLCGSVTFTIYVLVSNKKTIFLAEILEQKKSSVFSNKHLFKKQWFLNDNKPTSCFLNKILTKHFHNILVWMRNHVFWFAKWTFVSLLLSGIWKTFCVRYGCDENGFIGACRCWQQVKLGE